MQNWINFWSFLFWLSLVLFNSNLNNLIKLIFYSELVWIILYCYSITIGSINDDINLISSSVFIIGLAGLEYSIGILLLILFKNLNNSLDINNLNNNDNEIFNTNKIYLNRYFWKK